MDKKSEYHETNSNNPPSSFLFSLLLLLSATGRKVRMEGCDEDEEEEDVEASVGS